jgi:hypothetical protein
MRRLLATAKPKARPAKREGNQKVVVKNIDGSQQIKMRSVGSYKDFVDNREMANLAIDRFHKLSAEAQAAIIASMETEHEPVMIALNRICDMDEEEMNNLDPEEMEKLFQTAGIDPKFMFGAEDRVEEECNKIAEEIACEILELRNHLPAASRWRAKEKGMLSQVRQVEKFLLDTYVGDEEDSKLILRKIEEIEKLPEQQQRLVIEARKKKLLIEKENFKKENDEEKDRKLRILLPMSRNKMINSDLL